MGKWDYQHTVVYAKIVVLDLTKFCFKMNKNSGFQLMENSLVLQSSLQKKEKNDK